MALIENLTPDQQQAIATFKQKYPHIPPGGRLLQAWLGGHPESYADLKALSQTLGVPDDRALNPGTMSSERRISKMETLLTTLAIVGGAYVGGTALSAAFPAAGGVAPTAAGAAGGGAATGGTVAGTGGAAAGGAGADAAYIGSDIASTAASAGGASALVPTTITGLTTPGVGTVATTPAFATGGATGSAPLSFWDKVLGKSTADKVMTGLQLGGGLAGSLIQSHQADKATQAQVDAANKALALQSNIYQQQRADLAPYRNAGASSLSALTYGLGLDPSKSADTTTPYFRQQFDAENNAVPQNAQRNPNSPTTQPIPAGNYTGGQAQPRVSSLAGTAPDGTVAMMSPDGRQARVPQNQVQAALAAGGRLA